MTKFKLNVSETKGGWDAEGEINGFAYSVFGSTLCACIRGVADIVERETNPRKPKPYEVKYNEQ